MDLGAFVQIVRNRITAVVALLALVVLWVSLRSSSEKTAHKSPRGFQRAMLDEPARIASTRTAAVPQPRRGVEDVPLEELFDELVRLKDGLAEGRDALAAMTPDAPDFAEQAEQVNAMHAALARTRLSLLQEWSNEVRSHVVMNSDEQRELTAILHAEAVSIASGKQPLPPSARQAPSTKIEALLGPQRFARYQALQKSFFPERVHPAEILP